MSLNKFSNTQIGLDIGLEIGCDTLECNNLIVNDSIILHPTLIIDNLTVNNLLVNEECKVKCLDNTFVNFTTPNNGNLADILSTDGDGNCYWSSTPVPPGSGIIFNGVLPAENSRILKLSTIAGTTANSSCLIEDVTNLTCDKILKVQDIDGAIGSELKIGESVSVLTLETEPVLGSIGISSNTISSSSTSFTWNGNQIATLADIPASSTLQDIYDNSTPAKINYTDSNPIDFKNSEGTIKLHIEKTFIGIPTLKVDDISSATGSQITVGDNIESTGFIKTGSLNTEYLVADGSVKDISSIGSNQYLYDFETNIAAPPTPTHIRFNAVYPSITQVYISYLARSSINLDPFFPSIQENNILYIQQENDANNWIKFTINGTPLIIASSAIYIPVSIIDVGSGTFFPDNIGIYFSIFSTSVGTNPFNQSLNTSDDVQFNTVTLAQLVPLSNYEATSKQYVDNKTSSISLTNSGAGNSLLNSTSNPNFSTKGLIAGSNISISSNSTDLTLSNSSPASIISLSNSGSGNSLLNSTTNPNFSTKGLIAGSNISISSNSTDLTISASGSTITDLQQATDASFVLGNPALVNIEYNKFVRFKTNDDDTILNIIAGNDLLNNYRIEADRADIVQINSTTSTSGSFIKTGGTSNQYLMANGSSLEYSQNSGNSNFYLYNSINGITIAPPLSGKVGYNNANQSLATILYINHLTSDGIGIDVFFAQLTSIQDVYLQDKNSSLNFIKYNITGAPTIIANNYISIPVSYTIPNGGGTGLSSFGINHPIIVSFFTNSVEVDTRLSTLETKTQNQTAISGTTTFSGVGGIISNGYKLNPSSTNILLGDGTSQPQSTFTTKSQVNLLNKLFGTFQIGFSQTAALTATSAYLPTTAIVAIGSTTTAVTVAITTVRTRLFKVQNPTLSVANGQRSGYIGSGTVATWPFIFGSGGWNWNQSTGIGDTNSTSTAVTQMFVGLTYLTTTPAFSSTLGPNQTPSIIGYGHDVGDSVISIYYRGLSSGVKIATIFSAVTPSPFWFNFNISNDVGSDVCILTLTDIISNTTHTEFFTLTSLDTAATMSYNTRLFPLNCRAMAVLGGVTGSAITQFSRFQLSLQ